MTDAEAAVAIREKLAAARAAIAKHGIKRTKVYCYIPDNEPLLGRDARDTLYDLKGKDGTFRTVSTVDPRDILDLAGLGDDEFADHLADLLEDGEGDGIFVYEVPEDYELAHGSTLAFFVEE